MVNTTIGKYRITRLVGEGGMASVYEAEHEMLGTKVAIKVLNPMLSANAQIRERFRNEARLMASLDHPNITKVIDFDEQQHRLSIIMEYLSGEDLNHKIKQKGPLPPNEIVDIFSQTLSAFQYAHQNGVVHRDIKPSNIFILPNGHVKILDFGIAKLFGQGNEMTQTGMQIGTPIYMSPEQVKADKSIDHRSDIYSLGVTMYFAINGRPPYNSDSDSQFTIFNKIVFEPMPDFVVKSGFTEMVLLACQKNREDRFQSCESWLKEFIKTSNNTGNISNTDGLRQPNKGAKASKPTANGHKTLLQGTGVTTVIDNPTVSKKVEKSKTSNPLSWVLFLIIFVVLIYKFGSSDEAERGEDANSYTPVVIAVDTPTTNSPYITTDTIFVTTDTPR